MKRFYFICITVLFFAFSTHAVLASPFLTTNLNDRYILSENSTVRVEKSLVFTNKLSDHSIESYTMFFSNQSVPKNIEVKEDGLEASYTTRREDNLLAIVIPFKHPVQGIGKEKKLFVSYDLNGLVNNQQGYKELVIPVDPKNTEYEQYTIEVVAPGDFPALGLSKPRVNTVGDHSYQWTNVQTVQEQSVYIAFGSQALYTVELHYALKYEDGVPHRYEIPFIPDGAYQKVYIEHIDPVPEKTRIDEDDNIHVVTRYAGDGYFFNLVHNKKSGNSWDSQQDLVVAFKPFYGIWYHKLSYDSLGNMYLSYEYYAGQLFKSEAEAYVERWPEDGLAIDPPGTVASNSYYSSYKNIKPHDPVVIVSKDNGESWSLFNSVSSISSYNKNAADSNLAAAASAEKKTIFQKFFGFLRSFFGATLNFFLSLF